MAFSLPYSLRHARQVDELLDWLAEQDEATRSLLFVYSVTARDYGSPTTRERCVVTSFALEGEEDVNPAHV